MPNEARCSANEYINGKDLPTCSEESNEMWEEEFFASIISDQHSLDEEEPDDASFDIEPPAPKIRSFSKAIHSLEDVKSFLDRKGHSKQETLVSTANDVVASLNYSSLALGRQSTLEEYTG